MKRILSLFLSIVLVLSMCVGNVINVSASVEDKTMIEKTNTVIDMTDVETFTLVRGNYSNTNALSINGVKQHWMYIGNGGSAPSFAVSADNTTFGYPVMKMVYSGAGYAQIMFNGNIPSGAGVSAPSVTCSEAVVEGRAYLTVAGKPNWKTYPGATERPLSKNLNANTWYNFKITINTITNKMVMSYVEELSDAAIAEGATPHSVIDTVTYSQDTVSNFRFSPGTGKDGITYFDNFKMYYNDIPFEKAEITNAGTNDVVTGGQNILPLTLSADIPAITKDHITVRNTETNDIITADSIEITSDGTNPVVKATLASNLASWSEYEVTIDALAFGEGCMQRTGDDEPTAVTGISREFETSKPPFATKGFTFEASAGDLTAKGLVANTTGTPKDIKMVFSAFDSEGVQGAIAPTNYDDFNNADGEEIEAVTSIDGSEKYNFFIINNWTDKTPLLGVSAMVDESGNDVSENAVSGGALSGTEAAISADELNHDTLKLSVRVDTKEAAVADGILLVYKKGEELSDTNLPLYAKSVSTAADGTLSAIIPLSQSLDYGEFTVEFASASLASNLTDNFNHYTPAELLQARKDEILADAKAATTAAGLKEVLLGLNANDEQINTNFDIFGADANMTDYEAALDRENIFTRMLSSVASLGDYDALVSLFEEASAAQIEYEIENPTIMIEGIKATIADTTHTTTYAGTTANYTGTMALMTDSVKNHWMFTPSNGSRQKTYEFSNDTSFGGSVAKFEAISPTYFQMFFGGNIPSGSDITINALKGRTGIMEGRIRFTQAVTPKFKFSPEGGNSGELSIGGTLKADTWYKFKWEVVPGSYINVTFTEIGVDNPHEVSKKWNYTSASFSYFRFFPGVPAGESLYLDDVVITTDLVPYEKAKITSVGTASVVDGYQNTLSFELSNTIPGLTKDHITVTNKENGDVIAADAITVTGDTTQTVNVTLKSNLAGWSEYTLTVDPLAFGEGNFQRTGRQDLAEITALTADFTTTKAPLAAKTFTFTKTGIDLVAKALVSNTTGSAKDMQFVFANFNKDGRLISVVPTEHTGFSSGEEAYLEAVAPTQGVDTFNFFVIDDWTNKTPLFGANYTVNASGEAVEAGSVAGCDAIGTSGAAMELGEFDYDNIKIEVKLDTKENKVIDGILFVYKNGEVLSADNLPDYAKAVSTAADGTLTAEIILPEDLAYAAYTVEFVSDKLSGSVTDTFRYYSPDEILANKRAAILADAKVASSAEALQEVLMGVNSAGEKVNDNYDVFGKDADMANHNKNIDKLNVFTSMLPSLSSLGSYDALVNLFETCASNQRADEVAAQKVQIVNDAKQATNAQTLMMVILGVDANGNKVNDNFEVISSNANMSVYNGLKNQPAVFNHMVNSLSGVSDYNSLVSAFENAAYTQMTKENVRPSTSSNNSSYGGSSTAVKETVDTPVSQPGQSTTVSNSVFTDMSGHWAQNYAEALYKRGIMKGYLDGSFRGNNSITRAEIAKTIVEAFEIASGEGNSFSDVASDRWYSDYVASASAAGIVTGFADGSFGPDMAITRQDAAVMIYRALSSKMKLPVGYTFFNDDLDIADYASGAIRTLGDLGIITGNENKEFKPNNSITRAEIATIICRAMDYVESH